MSKPWKVVHLDSERIELVRDDEKKSLERPRDKANLAVFLATRPDEFADDPTIENFLAKGR